MNKKGAETKFFGLSIPAILVILFFVGYILPGAGVYEQPDIFASLYAVEGPAAEPEPGAGDVITTNCPSDGTTTFTLRQITYDTSGTAQWEDATYYIYEWDGSKWIPSPATSYTTATSSSATTGVDVSCGVKHKAISVVDAVPGETTDEFEFTPTGPTWTDDRTGGTNTSELDMKVKDVNNDRWVYEKTDNTSNAWTDMPDLYWSGDAGGEDGTNLSIAAAGDELKYDLYFRASEAGTVFGDLNTYLACDMATAYWEEPSVKVDGATRTNVKGSLNENDKLALADYEYVWDVGRVSRTEKVIRFTAEAKQDVTNTYSPSCRILSETRHLANDAVNVRTGIYKDDSSLTIQETAQTFYLSVS